MADDRKRDRDEIAQIDQGVGVVDGVTYTLHAIDINSRNVSVLDMTPEAARASIEVSRNQYAVPAEEETKQEQEQTKQEQEKTAQAIQETWRYAIAGVVLVLGFAGMVLSPEAAWPIAAGAAVLEAGIAAPAIIDRIRRRRGVDVGEE